ASASRFSQNDSASRKSCRSRRPCTNWPSEDSSPAAPTLASIETTHKAAKALAALWGAILRLARRPSDDISSIAEESSQAGRPSLDEPACAVSFLHEAELRRNGAQA